ASSPPGWERSIRSSIIARTCRMGRWYTSHCQRISASCWTRSRRLWTSSSGTGCAAVSASPSGARSGSRSWPQPSKTGFSPATPGLNPLAAAELVEAVVVDTEVVAELVDDGDGDLLDELLPGIDDVLQRQPVDRDLIRQRAGVFAGSLGERDPLVESQDAGGIEGIVLGDDRYVIDVVQ